MIASTVVGETFVDVSANDAIAGESFVTETLETALGVFTLGVFVAVVRLQETFVDIRTSGPILGLHGISLLAATLVGSQRVVARAVFAHVGRGALVYICKVQFKSPMLNHIRRPSVYFFYFKSLVFLKSILLYFEISIELVTQ